MLQKRIRVYSESRLTKQFMATRKVPPCTLSVATFPEPIHAFSVMVAIKQKRVLGLVYLPRCSYQSVMNRYNQREKDIPFWSVISIKRHTLYPC